MQRETMQITYLDLINCCRVCRSPNQDGDYEVLYETSTDGDEALPGLSCAGKLYEELLEELSPETYDYYPRYLCNSCGLQMKLFKKLKDKAIKTMEYLSQISIAKNLPELSADHHQGDFVHHEDVDVSTFHEHHVDGSKECSANLPYKFENDKPQMKLAQRLESATQNDAQEYGDLELALNETEETSLCGNSPSINENLQNSNAKQETVNVDLAPLEQFPLKVVIPETGDIVIPEPEHSNAIENSDYVLEIYELLEDGSQTVTNENVEESPEVEGDIDNSDNFEAEEVAGSEYCFNKDEYLDEDMASVDDSDDDPKYERQRRSIKLNMIDANRKEYKCTVCSEVFANAREFKHHREFVHAQVYKCNVCNKTFKSPYSIPTHMKIHDNTPAFQCELCPRTFTQKTHYKYHMNHHYNIRNYKCEECGKAFIGKTDLKTHMRLHNGDRPYVCDICGKDYMIAEHLKSHALKHTGQQFPCDLCLQNFATPKTLRLHKQTIHVDKPKFKCPYCMKPFRRKHHLQYHMKQLHPSTDILSKSLYDIMDETEDADDLDAEDTDAKVEDDDMLAEQSEYIQDPGFVALSDDEILM